MKGSHLIALTVIACALTCAGCGASKTRNSAHGGDSLAIQFARCMRAHGVSDFPDPSQGPHNDNYRLSPAFNSAQSTCNKLQPNNPPPPKPSKSRQLTLAKFARCMRAHGVPNFPDPTLTPPNGAGVIDVAGVFFVLPSSLNLQSPAVHHASVDCGNAAGPGL